MPYKRIDAVAFAEKFWNIPADDGVFWLSNTEVNVEHIRKHNTLHHKDWEAAPKADGWMPFFVSDGSGGEKAVFTRTVGSVTEEIPINSWVGLADCAHFLSRCLTAGGAVVSQLSVPKLVKVLQDRHDTNTLCERVGQEAGQRIVDSGIFKPGDMIGYFNIAPDGDYGGAKEYSHSTMYAGKIGGKTDGGVTCHTISRFPGKTAPTVEDSWWLREPGHYTYTLIHFTDDDPAPNPTKGAALSGWWKLDYSGRTEYYLVQKNGFAQYTKRAPAKGQQSIGIAEGSAYWFMSASGEITFIWRKSGTVEVWSPAGSGYKSKINGSVPGALTKLP